MSPKFIYHDMGIDRFDDYRANKFGRKNKSSSSSFLKDFYKGNKSHELWLKINRLNMNIEKIS